MHAVVRRFRTTIVEGRFVSLFTSLLIIGLRGALFLWGSKPQVTFTDSSFLCRLIGHFFTDPLIHLIASTLSVFLIAWIISAMNNRFNLIRSRSNLPFVVPLFLLSLHPWFLMMTGDYIAIILILLAFFPLLRSYQNPGSYLFSFRAGVLIAVASLFQLFALTLIPLWWRGELSMRGSQFRAYLSSLFGVFLVYISLFSVYLFSDDIAGFLHPFLSFSAISLAAIPGFSLQEWGTVVLVALFFISNMILSIKTYGRDKVLTLSLMQFVVFVIVFLLLLQVVYWTQTVFFLTLGIALISYLNAYFYTKTVSKTNVYLAYTMTGLMWLIYLSHFPFFQLLLP